MVAGKKTCAELWDPRLSPLQSGWAGPRLEFCSSTVIGSLVVGSPPTAAQVCS